MQYIEQNGSEHFHTFSHYPELLNKKVTLLKYFRDYMNDHLVKVRINTSAIITWSWYGLMPELHANDTFLNV